MIRTVSGQSTLRGEITPPGDKSIGHRAIILNAIAQGQARVANFCLNRDTLASIECTRALGVRIVRSRNHPGIVEVTGAGKQGLREPEDVLDARNSGTTMRLMSGLLAGQPFLSVVTGDASLRSRPMDRVVQPLRMMGADIQGRRGGALAPLVIRGGDLHGIEYSLPVPSAQVKSALLIAGLFSRGKVEITEPAPSRNHTELMLQRMGAHISSEGLRVTLSPPDGELIPLSMTIPGDISSAAYWLVAGAAHPDARIRIRNCGINPTRTGVIDILRLMGASITVDGSSSEGGEPVADLVVQSSEMTGIEIGGEMVVRAIDEVPVLAVAACFARGTTVVRAAGELRVRRPTE
jgi:3-phosphoshikimate 1-carboxyvinyltransferase